MSLALAFHLLAHFLSGVLAGYIAWRIWKKPVISFLSGIVGGFLVDLDHLFDYFLAFGLNFNLSSFLNGSQFVQNGKVYVLLHGWEYVLIFLFLTFLFKSAMFRTIFLSLAIGLFLHLTGDVFMNRIPIKSYSIVYRIENNFSIEQTVTPQHYQRDLTKKH